MEPYANMSPEQFVDEVMKTASGDMPAIQTRYQYAREGLGDAIQRAIRALQKIDDYKKLIYYGKGLDPNESLLVAETHFIDNDTLNILHAVLGISTEAGEMLEQLHAHIYEGKPLDKVNLMEEQGDSFWYHGLLSRLTVPFVVTWQRVIAKLRKRYGEKFDSQKAVDRNLEAERAILEGKSWNLGDCRLPICRAFSHQVNHAYCRACAEAMKR